MMYSKLQLEAHRVRDFQVEVHADGKNVPSSIGVDMPEIELGLFNSDEGNKFKLEITVIHRITMGSYPSFSLVRIQMDFIFKYLEQNVPQVLIENTPTLCISNGLGILRGILIQLTSGFEGGPYVLPLLDIKSIIEKHKEKEVALERPVAKPKAKKTPNIKKVP